MLTYIQKVYLAGGLSNDWQTELIKKFQDKFIFFNPRDHKLSKQQQFTVWDLHFVAQCDILFGYLERDNPSGLGLTLEIGYAKALNKTIILVDEKSSTDKDFALRFRIVRESSSIVFENLNDAINYLERFSIHSV